jgi:hypothetical protein
VEEHHFRVRAEDHGHPRPLSATADVVVQLVQSEQSGATTTTTSSSSLTTSTLRFRQSVYELAVPENLPPGTCLLQVDNFYFIFIFVII